MSLTKLVNGERVPLTEADITEREAEAIAWEAFETARILAATRATTRAALRAQWDALQPWINGPYRSVFDSVNHLLDEGKDAAAAELIDSCEPTTKISTDAATYPELGGLTRSQYFTAVKTQFKTAIDNL